MIQEPEVRVTHRNSRDAEMRVALRRWRQTPEDAELAVRLLTALDRAGMLPDSVRQEEDGPGPAAAPGRHVVRPIGSNMTEVDTGRSLVLVSYQTPVAFLSRGSTTAYVIDPIPPASPGGLRPSATTAKHIRQWIATHGVLGQEPADAEDIRAAMR